MFTKVFLLNSQNLKGDSDLLNWTDSSGPKMVLGSLVRKFRGGSLVSSLSLRRITVETDLLSTPSLCASIQVCNADKLGVGEVVVVGDVVWMSRGTCSGNPPAGTWVAWSRVQQRAVEDVSRGGRPKLMKFHPSNYSNVVPDRKRWHSPGIDAMNIMARILWLQLWRWRWHVDGSSRMQLGLRRWRALARLGIRNT